MSFVSILFIAIALAMDSFAVSIAYGTGMSRFRSILSLYIAGVMGFFQAFMPLLGWLLGEQCTAWVSRWDHWIAFGLLLFLGVKMIWDSLKPEEEYLVGNDEPTYQISFKHLTLSGIATSIDAFAVGISFGLLATDVALSVCIIGMVTFLLSLTGVWLGHRFARSKQWNVRLLGGILLIGIGLKILFFPFSLLIFQYLSIKARAPSFPPSITPCATAIAFIPPALVPETPSITRSFS